MKMDEEYSNYNRPSQVQHPQMNQTRNYGSYGRDGVRPVYQQRPQPERQRPREQSQHQPFAQQPANDRSSSHKNKLLIPLIIVSGIAILFFALWLSKPTSTIDSESEAKIRQLESELYALKSTNDAIPDKEESSPTQEERETTIKTPQKKEYGLGEYWVVDGQWKLKIDSVTVTEDRNQFSDKTPAQVVIIKYSYENLGYENNIQDLYMIPESVIDGNGKMGDTYPLHASVNAKPTPVGAMCEGAEKAYGLNNVSAQIRILFSEYDGDRNKQRATFVVPVE